MPVCPPPNRGTGDKVRAKGWRNVTELHPRLAVPIHYACTAGPIGDRILVKLDRDHPEHHQDAARDLAPGTEVHILPTGQVLTL